VPRQIGVSVATRGRSSRSTRLGTAAAFVGRQSHAGKVGRHLLPEKSGWTIGPAVPPVQEGGLLRRPALIQINGWQAIFEEHPDAVCGQPPRR
jgi:hypothetical protein